jgi:hypothetical protein
MSSLSMRAALAALVLAATVAGAGSAWAVTPIGPNTPGSTWTDPGTSTVSNGVPLPPHR